ncbi:hypothetical protein [Dyadobacter frigoris]|uniref:Uncharacterized protein n=1 Tax=Dyadobacter frigoris TaxID=2576211 RepID=A0A4U6CX60_9BACT|nr:hypothetical protein [Dyadobacter frigoris]TKT88926.1 hypothetical protein FDK13_25175 [Dyadobacter frigoris]GLU56975.1 hypothetical protein Dfri01_64360 [Dyadobacter frigoris]
MTKVDYKFDFENIFDNPDAEDEKYFAGNGMPVCALRLYNFITGDDKLIENHKLGIYKYIFLPLRSQVDYWINLVGYASKIGDRGYNSDLSIRRCVEVQREILTGRNKLNVAEFRKKVARGSDASTDAADDDFGYWRSVKIYAHKGAPPPPNIEPKPVLPAFITQKFAIKMVGGRSISIFKMFGRDNYLFKIKNMETFDTACFFYAGTSVAAGGPGSPVSIAGSGDWVPFTTSSRFKLALKDFNELNIALAQQPGISAGSNSVFGNFMVDFQQNKNKQFAVRETSINPSTIIISADGMGFSTALTASNGNLKMMDCPRDLSEPDWA